MMLEFLVAMLLVTVHPGHDGAPEQAPAPTPLEHAAWLEGRWVGTGLGGEVEEVWSPASGGQMVGHFIYSKDGAVQFYELLLLDVTDEGLRMRVKHFNADMTAWEEKGEWVTFAPDATMPGLLLFKGLSIRNEGGRMEAVVQMRNDDGEARDAVFNLARPD